MKHLFKTVVLLLGLLMTTVSCQKENLNEPQESSIENGSNDLISVGELKDFKNLNQYIKKDIIDVYNTNLQFRTLTEDTNGFTIIADEVTQVTTDSLTTYTLKIVKDNQPPNSFSNLIISFSLDNSSSAFIINYYPTQNYLASIETNPQAVFEGQVNFEAIDYNEDLNDYLGLNRLSCSFISVMFCNWSEGNVEGEEHFAGPDCTSSFMYSRSHMICVDSSAFEPENNNTLTQGSSGGGGTGSSSLPSTNPKLVRPCEINNTSLNGNNIQVADSGCDDYSNGITEEVEAAIIRNILISGLSSYMDMEQYLWLDTIATAEERLALYTYLEHSSDVNGTYQVEALNFITELILLAANDDNYDINVFKFVLQAKIMNKMVNPFDDSFLSSVNPYLLINTNDFNLPPHILWEYLTVKCAVLRDLHPDWSDLKVYWEASKDFVHITLDVFGLVPVVGEVADLTNGVLYTIEGDGLNATLSFASTVPIAGWAAFGTKYAIKIVDASQTAYTIGTKVRLTWKVLSDGTIYFGSNSTCRRQLRKALGMAPFSQDARQAHHIIPLNLQTNPVVQKAAKSDYAFHLNEALNGIPLEQVVHNGSHSVYDGIITQKLINFTNDFPNATPNQCYDKINEIIQDIRTAILNNPNTPINQLNF